MTTTQTPLKSLPPIGLASITSAVVMYPVDVWRALNMASATGAKQTVGSFVKAHGISGMLKQGVGPEIARATLMRVFKFFNYPIVHRFMFVLLLLLLSFSSSFSSSSFILLIF